MILLNFKKRLAFKMEIQNKQTKIKYKMPLESWEALGKNQKLFAITDNNDTEEVAHVIIENVKPNTGNKNNTQKTNTSKNKK